MKKFIVFLIILVAIIALLGMFLGFSNRNYYENISALELNDFMINNPNYEYVDVRGKDEYNQGHIEGFENIENTKILEGEISFNKEIPIVLICRSGNRSAEVAKYLSKQGYEIINIEDGIINYEGELEK